MSSADLPPSLARASAVDAIVDDTRLGRLAAKFTELAERYVPDAFVFALVATVAVVIAAMLLTDATPLHMIDLWGAGFWELLPFTMQMALVIITGYVVATSPPVYRLIARVADVPRRDRTAVAMVALFAMLSAWLNWGFSLIFSAILAKEVARRRPQTDYRALGAAAFMGLGSIWAQGLSGSAALLMATESAVPQSLRDIVSAGGIVPGGIIPLRHTIFLWQSFVSVAVEISIVTVLFYVLTPTGARAKGAEALGISLGEPPQVIDARAKTPGEWLEHSRILSFAFAALALTYLVRYFAAAKDPLSALSFNTVNLIFLTAGVLLHGTPHRLMRAVKEATPGIWALVLQYPFYAGIAALISKTKMNAAIAGWFVSLSSAKTFPALIAVYSAVLGMFVPSGGSKWVIEAPYVIQAAHDLKVHVGWMVAVYDLGEALANLVQPFWMLPVLGLLGLRARDVMGYTFLVFLVLAPVVLLLVTVLPLTLGYPF